jgi:hypothetical protein
VIEAIALVVATVGLALWTLQPLLRPKKRDLGSQDGRASSLLGAKHAIYRSILDLDFDHQLGKVSDSDYQYLRRQHEAEALTILKELAGAPSSTEEFVDLLEAEIAAARERRRKE